VCLAPLVSRSAAAKAAPEVLDREHIRSGTETVECRPISTDHDPPLPLSADGAEFAIRRPNPR